MIKNISIALRFFLFWLTFFFLERLIFILSFRNKLQGTQFSEIAKSFVIGLWMDASMAAYISALPLLAAVLIWFIPTIKIPSKVLRWYVATLVVAFSIICAFNFNIYREWGSKINYKALDVAFSSPGEAIASSSSSPVFVSFLVLLGLIALSIWLSRKIISYRSLKGGPIIARMVVSVLLIGCTFLAVRGGWQLSPMNESMAYYSNKPLLNHAAVNTEWALMRDILNNNSNKNPYNYHTQDHANNLLAEVFKQPDVLTPEILSTRKPNIVLIIMESFTADVVESLGGEKGVAPQIEKLASQGLMFENIFASGDRTDKGVVAVLNAFPSQAIRSIMKINSKQENLPSLAATFSENGYNTKFFYGGESEFFNMKSYLLSHKYQDIIDKNDFDEKDMNSKWGAYDEVVFNRLIKESGTTIQPFFHTVLTLTHHEPFEVPGTPRFGGETIENKFRSTAFYADSCVGAFINQAKKQDWYKNTVFILVADHGHRLPKNESEIYHPNRFRIPLLMVGDAIKPEYRGKRITKIGSQTDLATTLFHQLGMKTTHFKWSRDLLNPKTKDFAFFDWDNGFGVVTPDQAISFDNTGKTVLHRREPENKTDEKLVDIGKAYMQTVFQEYLDY
jgi:phosphoglycerol transferase MdoB-like AlkP superfamily enzyme